MKKFIFVLFIFSSFLQASDLDLFLMAQNDPSSLVVNNRVLAKVEGVPITVLDLTKRLDMFFFKDFPNFVSSSTARYQFYQANWQAVLEDMIQKQLMKEDAKDLKIEISHGEIRQRLESLFGPDIVLNLEKANLSIDDANKMIEEDLLLDRMMAIRIYSKVFRKITPSDLCNAYEELSKNESSKQTPLWKYQVLTIKDPDQKKAKELASIISQKLKEEKIPFEKIKENLDPDLLLTSQIHLSPLYSHNEEELSPQYKAILLNLENQTFSLPQEQKSRSENILVYRVFYLEKYRKGGIPSFEEIENNLREHLIQKTFVQESKEYFEHLTTYFDLQKPYLEDEKFTPFILCMP